VYCRKALFCSILSAFATAAAAQEPSGRVDLDVLAGNPLPQLVVGRVIFSPTDAACPQQLGTLRLRSDGQNRELTGLGFLANSHNWTWNTTPLDDETYRHRVATSTCRVDLDIRQQVRRDGVWTALFLPRPLRPSLSPEERSAAKREQEDRPSPSPAERFGRYRDALDARSAMGSLRQGGPITISQGFGFEGVQTCFDAVGDYLVEQNGVAFQFVTDLPGNLNRFVLERIDVDDDHSRLSLSRDDCRVEITIGASILWQGQWVARSIAPFIPSQSRMRIDVHH
jgi:hypothetical protein